MAIPIEMPKLSDTMSEGKILSWKKSEGDAVLAGEVLAEIESDKANMEMEAYDSGYLRKIVVPEGRSAPVGAIIAVITAERDEDIAQILTRAMAPAGKAALAGHEGSQAPAAAPAAPWRPAAAAMSAAAPPPAAAAASRPASPATNGGSGTATRGRKGAGRVLASPLAFRMAAELGLDLTAIRGSGPAGRIVKRDVLDASGAGAQAARADAPLPAASPAAQAKAGTQTKAGVQLGAPFRPPLLAPVPPQSHEDIPVSSMRRIIGARLVESKTAAPHFYLTVEVDMKAVLRAREELNRITGVNVTYNDLVVKAVAACLLRHPGLNACWQGDFIRRYRSVDIGIAVALPDGLLTPVVRACHLKSLGAISEEIKDLVERAKTKKLTPDDYKGGTFTVSNLGMFGVKHFTAIINPPEACILAVSAVEEVPVVEGGAVVPGHRMSLTLSSDHRVVDGALAAQFMRDLKQVLETPVALAL